MNQAQPTKKILSIFSLVFVLHCFGQQDDRISTMDFVQVLNDNKQEALYYYQNNWKILREMALSEKYIDSYQLLETTPSEEAPFTFMLITTYANEGQYSQREENFAKLIEQRGPLKLLNEKQPAEFRKTSFGKLVKHWK